MQIERIFGQPNKHTFLIYPIKKLLEEINTDYSNWCDPFAGENSPCGTTNDIRTSMQTTHHGCALDFLKSQPSSHYDGVLYDPPYSLWQAKECYEGAGMKNIAGNMRWWADIKDNIQRIIKPEGTAVCFGWSSMGLGKSRGFEMNRVLLVPHGGSKNDTIVTVETKI